jgi:hydroxyethylthiazole kinase-like uncharacterized protein yjeF
MEFGQLMPEREANMQEILSGSTMQQCDRSTMEYFGVISPVLMERAALKIADYIIHTADQERDHILAVCGSGNNGGDGIAAARLLCLAGYHAEIYFAGNREHVSDECGRQLSVAEKYGIPIHTEYPPGRWTILVDSIFGIGLSRTITGRYAELIRRLNDIKARKIAVDIPSGIHADTGQIMGCAFRADVTVTMGFYKIGQLLYPGAACCGRLIRAEIGIDHRSLRGHPADAWSMEKKDLALMPKRCSESNKGSYGRVLLAAGSRNMAGAAILAARAAYAAGCGLVRILTPECNRIPLQTAVPGAILTVYDEERADEIDFEELCGWADAAAVGPGLGQTESSFQLVKGLLTAVHKRSGRRKESGVFPCVIDADGLNLISAHAELRHLLQDCILTPHMGEMSRLTGRSIAELKDSPVEAARSYAKDTGASIVMKDARTVIVTKDGRCFINCSGNHGMAVGGTGDVLTGLLSGILAQDGETAELIPLGVYIHGLAGDAAASEKGPCSLQAEDLINGIGIILKKVYFHERI